MVWTTCPESLPWPVDETHVWRSGLKRPPDVLTRFAGTLFDDERERAEKFLSPGHRDAYIVSRGVLRDILSRYLQVEPRAIRFSYSEYGKPQLAGVHTGSLLRFNVSHSGDLVLYAMTAERNVGIDIEFMREGALDDRMQIAQRFFSPREYNALKQLPESMRHHAFFTCWTRKEAFIKARGEGFSLPLHQFDVSVSPDEDAALLHTDWAPDEANRWSLMALYPGEGYAATLAVEGQIGRCRCWAFE